MFAALILTSIAAAVLYLVHRHYDKLKREDAERRKREVADMEAAFAAELRVQRQATVQHRIDMQQGIAATIRAAAPTRPTKPATMPEPTRTSDDDSSDGLLLGMLLASTKDFDPVAGKGGTFDGGGASGDWDRSPSSVEPSNYSSSSDSPSSSSPSSDSSSSDSSSSPSD